MADIELLSAKIQERFERLLERVTVALNELTIEVARDHLQEICLALRDDPEFDFKLLIDVCGVDYLKYGLDEWETESTTETGFGRGVIRNHVPEMPVATPTKPRFAS